MNPKLWGPGMWFFLHTVSFNYPEQPTYQQKRHYYDFFQNLYYILPCDECRQHYFTFLNQNPVTPFLDSKTSLVKWVIKLHNNVNKLTNKPSQDYDEVVKRYQKITFF